MTHHFGISPDAVVSAAKQVRDAVDPLRPTAERSTGALTHELATSATGNADITAALTDFSDALGQVITAVVTTTDNRAQHWHDTATGLHDADTASAEQLRRAGGQQ